MKIAGYIILSFGILVFVLSIISIANSEDGSSAFSGGLMWLAIGAYLISRAKKKEKEKKEKDDWIKGNKE